ncbi:MAG: nucleotide sugar dehydrogenase [Bacteroidetes bacterium]|nr:nucleotide sugar dehydrogenase [Bacteroidota bacterium]MCL6103711.1 nucleotide sugar dehydrogenase [Bacteroidota bacterium]
MEKILNKINNNSLQVGVIGLGYVGLPLAVSFATAGIRAIGFDVSVTKVDKVNAGNNYIQDIRPEQWSKVQELKTLSATTNFSLIARCDAVLICVPTPLDLFHKPDMRFIESACREIGKYLKSGTFVSLESTTYPTTTEHFVLPLLEEASGLTQGKDFWLAFSPERVDPGNKTYDTRNTPKVLGAMTAEGLTIGKAIYSKAIDQVYTVSSPKVAEMVKILENTYRLVNISLINEMALLSGKMGIDIWEVIEAAKTKPYGFQAFYPGPGIGGHCIPLDPFYLEYIAKKFNFDLTMIHTAGHIDMLMPHRATIKLSTALNRHKKPINGSKILFLGVAYKPDVDDERESPALKIMDIVAGKGGEVLYHDPFVATCTTPGGKSYSSSALTAKLLQSCDCVVVTTNHTCFDAAWILENSVLIVDLRNGIKVASEKVYKL